MTSGEFGLLLVKATEACTDWTRTCVTDYLPDEVTYRVLPNQSCDVNPLVGDEEIYPQDSLAKRTDFLEMNQNQVVNYFCRKGKVPEWIDMAVCATSKGRTILQLVCCGRFTGEIERMYYHKRGMGPFGIKMQMPIFYDGGEPLPKFSLQEAWPLLKESE